MKYKVLVASFMALAGFVKLSPGLTYPIVDTDVRTFYNNTAAISEPAPGNAFYGQDATYSGNQPSYTDNRDGTITDNVTGLMWQKDMGPKITCSSALVKADTMTLGGYSDWRIPTIKELYSLIVFTGQSTGTGSIKKYIDTVYFNQPVGNVAIGERIIDTQTWSSTQYTGLTMAGDFTVFGVNFIDGRIKGYPKYKPGTGNATPNTMYFRMVRGSTVYGVNDFIDNKDGTITDKATGLMWQKADDAKTYDWEHALFYAESLSLSGYSDWRLPNAKELQSIVDYTRSPTATNSPAISPLFSTTSINDPDGNPGHYPYFWTGTTHLDGANPYSAAVYIAFGKAFGKMNNKLMDVHGAGAQRSDPKTGDPANYPSFMGPQGDARIVFNFVRCVRNASSVGINNGIKQSSIRSGIELFYDRTAQTLSFTSNSAGPITLRIYDCKGTAVAVLENRVLRADKYSYCIPESVWASRVVVAELKSGSLYTRIKIVDIGR